MDTFRTTGARQAAAATADRLCHGEARLQWIRSPGPSASILPCHAGEGARVWLCRRPPSAQPPRFSSGRHLGCTAFARKDEVEIGAFAPRTSSTCKAVATGSRLRSRKRERTYCTLYYEPPFYGTRRYQTRRAQSTSQRPRYQSTEATAGEWRSGLSRACALYTTWLNRHCWHRYSIASACLCQTITLRQSPAQDTTAGAE